MASELCMNCFSVKGQYEVCPYCGYVEGTPPEHPQYLTPGTILANHFIVGTAIDMGGFGITYRCYDTTLGIAVAVKEFFPAGLVNRAPGESVVGLLSGDKQQQYRVELKRFLMEAQSIAQFGKAKDIVNVYAFFEENNTAYIIMEYIDGVLLKDYLEKQGKMEPQVALHIIDLIINAVKKIHSKGIIHRDISPDNIFISSEDAIKVFDFGAAQLNDSAEGKNCEKVIKVGYSAPEQYRDKSNQGFYTDIYSVGAILYQMLTGIKPMESTEREHKDTLKSPLELGVKIEPNVDRAIMEAMAVQPELRFQNIQQFEDALHSKRIAEYPNVKLKKKKHRRNWIIGAVATAVLALGVGFGLMNTVFKSENPVFESQLSEGKIEVWVDNASQKKILTDIINNNYHQEDVKASDSSTANWLKENKKIEVEVVDVSEGAPEGTDTETMMQTKLDQAKEAGTMPDMFITDNVEDLSKYDLMSYEDNVYKAVEDKMDEYLYLSDYKEYYKDMNEMPTGIDSLFVYGYELDNADYKLSSSPYLNADAKSVSMEDIKKEDENMYLMVPPAILAPAAVLQNEDCFDVKQGLIRPDDIMVSNLYQLVALNETASGKKIMKNSAGTDYGLYGNTALAGRSFCQTLKTVMDADKNTISKYQIKDYTMQVVTEQDRMLIQYKNAYAISDDSTTNEKNACMRLLWTILGEVAQENYYGDDNAPFPINEKAFEAFFDYNSHLTAFKDMVLNKEPCFIVGRGQKALRSFGIQLENSFQGVKTQEAVKAYCQNYSRQQETQ